MRAAGTRKQVNKDGLRHTPLHPSLYRIGPYSRDKRPFRDLFQEEHPIPGFRCALFQSFKISLAEAIFGLQNIIMYDFKKSPLELQEITMYGFNIAIYGFKKSPSKASRECHVERQSIIIPASNILCKMA